jgi:hypothetical protein
MYAQTKNAPEARAELTPSKKASAEIQDLILQPSTCVQNTDFRLELVSKHFLKIKKQGIW